MVAGGAGSIGILALQGDVREHRAAVAGIGAASREVRRVGDLDGLDGLVLPGGESTTLSMLLVSTGLWEPLDRMVAEGFPVLGTCAGLVLLAREVLDGRPDQRTFAALDLVVRRNGFGRQVQSFEADLDVGDRLDPPGAGGGGARTVATALPAVFIRAPRVVESGPEVEVLASLSRAGDAGGPTPVLVRQGRVLASVFHPELTADRRVHRLFAEMCGC